MGVATIGRILGRSVGYISQIILARVLAPDGFGLFAIGWTILRLFSIAGHLGLDYGIIHFGSRYWQKDDTKFRNIFTISLAGALFSGFFFGVVTYLIAPWLATSFFKKPELEIVLRGFAFIFPFATSLRVLAATSSLSGKMLCGAVAEDVTQPFLQIAIFLYLHQTGMEISAAILSTILSYAIAVFVGFSCIAKLIPFKVMPNRRISMLEIFTIFKYSLPTILAATLGAFNLWGDRLIVGYFGTKTDTGIYQSISIITMFTTIILSGIKTALSPIISQLFHHGEHAQLKSIAKSISRWSLYLSTPILLLVAIASDDVITLAFGAEYKNGAIPLFWLTIGQLFYISFGIADQFFIMTGKQKDWLAISVSIFTLTIFLDALVIPIFGILGAAVVSCGMMLLMGVTASIRLKHNLFFWLFDRFHLKIWIASALSGVITLLIIQQLNILLPLPRLTITFLFSFFLFALLVWAIGINPEDKALINRALSRK